MMGILYLLGTVAFLLVSLWLFIAFLKLMGYSIFMESKLFEMKSDMTNEEKKKAIKGVILLLVGSVGMTCYFAFQYDVSKISFSIEGVLLTIAVILTPVAMKMGWDFGRKI